MTRGEAWFSHLSTVLVGGTGLVYGWMRYVAEPEDPFAVANHPAQPTLQHLHVLFAPLLVFACALVWRDHVWKRVHSGFRARRRTGLLLFALFAPMIASGYLLQTAGGERARLFWLWVHDVASCGWLLGYAVHQLSRRRQAAGVRG